ncbi:hypothetical protein K490DRAFT_57102 [Saccharata proteae CBS 121410]|uniref:SET domain-containing protein n=1 Tax=Saccharata proteae CBS 121410 TaxID=1314787 RepID=A0A9P4HWW0_9PEZI|nr:hypothetical protein K490DRAFT_57102 [Saccharata proteae CBS 121410]
MQTTFLPTNLYDCKSFSVDYLSDVVWSKHENEYDLEISTQKAALLLREHPHTKQLLNEFVSTAGEQATSDETLPIAIAKASYKWAAAYETKFGSTHAATRESLLSQPIFPSLHRPQLRRKAVSDPGDHPSRSPRSLIPKRQLETSPSSSLETMADKLARRSITPPDFSEGSGGFEFFLESMRSIPGPGMAPTLRLDEMPAREAECKEEEQELTETSLAATTPAAETSAKETSAHLSPSQESTFDMLIDDLREAAAGIGEKKEAGAEEASGQDVAQEQPQRPEPSAAWRDTSSTSGLFVAPEHSDKEPTADNQPSSDAGPSAARTLIQTILQQLQQPAPSTETGRIRIELMDRAKLSTFEDRRALVVQTFPELFDDGNMTSKPIQTQLFSEQVDAKRGHVLRANEEIKAGTLIMSEKPAFLFRSDREHIAQFYDLFMAMPAQRQRKILEIDFSCSLLRTAHIITMQHMTPEKRAAGGNKLIILLAIALRNHSNVKFRLNLSTIYLESSRIQYSCISNSERYWNEKTKTCDIRAIRPIKPGEVITHTRVANLADSMALMPRPSRFVHFGALALTCTCDTCSKDESQNEVKEAEKLRVRAADLIKKEPDPFNMDMKQLEPLLEVCEEIGFRGSFMAYMYMRASHFHFVAGLPARGFEEAEKSVRLVWEAKGDDNEQFSMAHDQLLNIERNLSKNQLNKYWRAKYGHKYVKPESG